MNKKLLTLAVAAAIAAPAAAVADATVYGRAELSLDSWDVNTDITDGKISPVKNFGFDPKTDWTGFDGLDVGDGYHSNRFGIKGSEDLGNGLKAIYKMEFSVKMADADSNFTGESSEVGSSRNMYVGLSGDWGTALIGRHDTPHKTSTGRLDMFADTVADYNFGNGIKDIRADNIIMYVSPNWNGLTISGALIAPGGKCAGTDEATNSECRSSDDTVNLDSDGFEGYSIAAMYSNGPWYASASYESISDEAYGGGAGADDDEKWRIGFGYTMNAFKIGAVYEDWEWGGDTGLESTSWQISAAYTFGNNVVKAMYGQMDLDGSNWWSMSPGPTFNMQSDEDTDTWAIGLEHNFSKRTQAYIIYTAWEGEDGGRGTAASPRTPDSDPEYDVWSIGLRHSF